MEPSTWNSLPTSVLHTDSLVAFKSKLKTHLFTAVYSSMLPGILRVTLKLWHYGTTHIIMLLLLWLLLYF